MSIHPMTKVTGVLDISNKNIYYFPYLTSLIQKEVAVTTTTSYSYWLGDSILSEQIRCN